MNEQASLPLTTRQPMRRCGIKKHFVFCLLSIILLNVYTVQSFGATVSNPTASTLRFGRLAAPTNGSSGTVTIAPTNGARTSTNVFVDTNSNAGAACFTVTFGLLELLNPKTFTVTINNNPTNGAGSMTLTDFTLSSGSTILQLGVPLLDALITLLGGLLSGPINVCVGATLNVNNGQTPIGEYTGQINLRVQ